MVGSAIYRIEPWTKLETSFGNLVKTHYKKKNRRKALSEFQTLLADFLEGLKVDPRPSGSFRESLPKSSQIPEDCEFWKMRWRNLPGLHGPAAYGRLMYVIFESKKLVYPFWIYTHAAYSEPKSRPPDIEILKQLKGIIAHGQR